MHSYAGVAGSSSLFGLSLSERTAQGHIGGVKALVCLCAWTTPLNESVHSSGSGQGGRGGPSKVEADGDYTHHLDPVFAFYNDLTHDVAQEHASRLTHHSFPTLKNPLTYAAYQDIPSTHLLCTNDNTIPYEGQLNSVEDAACPVWTVTYNAGRSPVLSQPALTARVVRRAAGEDVRIGGQFIFARYIFLHTEKLEVYRHRSHETWIAAGSAKGLDMDQ